MNGTMNGTAILSIGSGSRTKKDLSLDLATSFNIGARVIKGV